MGLDEGNVERRVRQAMEFVRLDYNTYAERSPFRLSGGQQRRVAIAGVIAMHPDFLIMDEPTNHLDVQAKEALKTALSTFAGTVLLVSHEEAFYRDWTQRIINIEKK